MRYKYNGECRGCNSYYFENSFPKFERPPKLSLGMTSSEIFQVAQKEKWKPAMEQWLKFLEIQSVLFTKYKKIFMLDEGTNYNWTQKGNFACSSKEQVRARPGSLSYNNCLVYLNLISACTSLPYLYFQRNGSYSFPFILTFHINN